MIQYPAEDLSAGGMRRNGEVGEEIDLTIFAIDAEGQFSKGVLFGELRNANPDVLRGGAA